MRSFVDVGFDTNTDLDLGQFHRDPGTWLAAQGAQGTHTWLLAYAEDGVIWGRLENGTLLLSRAEPLDARTLLEARLFGESGELHLWRTDNGFGVCHVTDRTGPASAGAYDEWQRLWGVDAEGQANGFTQLVDGQEGLRHAVPLVIPSGAFHRAHPRYQPTILQTRHYFAVDEETGVTSIVLSRLVCIKAETFDEYRKRVNNYGKS